MNAGRTELLSPMVLDAAASSVKSDGLYFITSDVYHRHHCNKIMRTLAYMRHIIVYGTADSADKLRTLHSLAKEYKFDAEFFHFMNDA